MRVLYFSRDYTPHDYRFLSSLADTEHELYFMRLERRPLQLEDRSLAEKVHIIPREGWKDRFSFKDTLSVVRRLKSIIREMKPDVIHAGPIQTCAFLSVLTGFRPLVLMSWGSDILVDGQKSSWLKWVTKYTLKHGTILLADNDAVREKAISLGVAKDRIVQFPWGVDLKEFTPVRNDSLRERKGWQDNFVILSLRSWEPIYGVDVLAKAFAEAVKEIPQLRLVLLGNGSQAGLIRSILEQSGVQDKVFYGGQVSQKDLPVVYQSADLYISASHSDGSSVSLMEALASGLPVLVSDIPGNREWVAEGENGWFFKDGDTQDLKEQIIRIYARNGNLSSIRENARRKAEQKAKWEDNFEKLLTAYRQAQKIHQNGSRG